VIVGLLVGAVIAGAIIGTRVTDNAVETVETVETIDTGGVG
jgi:hypothetical protein